MLRRFHALFLAMLLVPAVAFGQASRGKITIGVLTDMSGPYASVAGSGAVDAVRMAIEDWHKAVNGMPVELVFADHQNKADVAAGIATKWYDNDGVDVIVDLIGSPISLAVQDIAKARGKVSISVGSASTALTGKGCSATGLQWLYSSVTNARSLAEGVKNASDGWFFLTVDDAGGRAIESGIRKVLDEANRKVTGQTKFPLNTTDFSSYLIQAQTSGAKVLVLAAAGANVSNAIKQANEFGITKKGMRIVVPFLWITDVHALGLPAAQGLQVPMAFYWNLNDKTRDFGRRFFLRNKSMPTDIQAGDYTAVNHFLKAVKQVNSRDGVAIADAIRSIPIQDFMTSTGKVRADGTTVRERVLYEVKRPEESKEPWDYFKPIANINAEAVLDPLSESECPLVRK